MSMLSPYSAATGLSSPPEDDAPPPPLSFEADVLDRDRDEVYTENGCRDMTYDELHEILAWMPAKAAIRFSSSLCTWSRNIRSDLRFIENQCTRSCGHDNGFFLQNQRNDDGCHAIEFNVLPGEMGSAFGIPTESLGFLSQCRVLYSSNGLLILGKTSRRTVELILCNPATREWATLPTPNGFKVHEGHNAVGVIKPMIECYPWGHDLLDVGKFPYDYTIALPVIGLPFRHGLLIYSNGIWEDDIWDVRIEGPGLSLDKPVSFYSDATKGLVVHYMCDSEIQGNYLDGFLDHTYVDPYIAAFDIREKKLIRQINLPEEAWSIVYERRMRGGTRENLWIEKWKENSIILVRWPVIRLRGSITAWVLDDYGCKEESWRLVMEKSELEMWKDYNWTKGVGVASGRGVLIATSSSPIAKNRLPACHEDLVGFEDARFRVFLYVVEGENKGKMQLVGDHHFNGPPIFVSYCNTLRPVAVKNVQTCTY